MTTRCSLAGGVGGVALALVLSAAFDARAESTQRPAARAPR